jgi:hypothetical protein
MVTWARKGSNSMANIIVQDNDRAILTDALDAFQLIVKAWRTGVSATSDERELGRVRDETLNRLRAAVAESFARNTASSLPPILVPIDPDADVVELTVSVCRNCADSSGWCSDEVKVYEWRGSHHKGTGHDRFHMWRIGRSKARLVNMPA